MKTSVLKCATAGTGVVPTTIGLNEILPQIPEQAGLAKRGKACYISGRDGGRTMETI